MKVNHTVERKYLLAAVVATAAAFIDVVRLTSVGCGHLRWLGG